MKFSFALPLTALLALATAAPSPSPIVDDSIQPFALATPPSPKQLHPPNVDKRAQTISIGLWTEKWNGGVKKIPTFNLDFCYNLLSPWNDVTQSLEVPKNYACVFFASWNCDFNEHARLYVFGEFIGDLDPWGLSKKISAVYCYNPNI